MMKDEIILKPNPHRFVLFPIQYEEVWSMYKKQMACFWTVAEVDLGSDVAQWDEKLSDNERHFISHVLAFFAASDGIVLENFPLQDSQHQCILGKNLFLKHYL